MHPIVALWAHPRSLSTALERVFIERGDFEVFHEPFSVVYYLHERRAAPALAEADAAETADYPTVREQILRAAERGPVCFKDMAYHGADHLTRDDPFLDRLTHLFLIREPRQTLASHYAKNPQLTCEEVGYEQQARLFDHLCARGGETPLVIAAEDLQRVPKEVIAAVERRLGLAARPDTVRWQPGFQPQWSVWKSWHQEVAESGGIRSGQTKYAQTVDNHPRLAELLAHHQPFYEALHAQRLRID